MPLTQPLTHFTYLPTYSPQAERRPKLAGNRIVQISISRPIPPMPNEWQDFSPQYLDTNCPSSNQRSSRCPQHAGIRYLDASRHSSCKSPPGCGWAECGTDEECQHPGNAVSSPMAVRPTNASPAPSHVACCLTGRRRYPYIFIFLSPFGLSK